MAEHLKLKGTTWYFRLAVPQDLQEAAGKREVLRSTGTADKIRARRVAAREYLKAQEWFDALRDERAPSENEMTAVAQRVFADQASMWAGVSTEEIIEFLADDVIDRWRGFVDAEYPMGAASDAHAEIERLVDANRLVMKKGTESHRRFSRKIARAHIAAAKEALRKARGDYSAQPVDDFTDDAPTTPTGGKGTRSRSRSTLPTARQVFEQWISEGSRKWSPRTVSEFSTGKDVFLEVLGDLVVADITRDDIRRLRDTLLKLPTGWRQAPQWRDLTATEIIETDPVGPLLKPGTVTKYLLATKRMLDHAAEEGHVSSNVAAGLTTIHDPEPVHVKRNEWSIELLNKWFSYEIYKEPRSKWDHRQWLPLFGLYTGARLEELARLRADEVREVDGVLVLDIRWREGENLKSKAAERIVPVHSALLEMGFAKYVARVANKSDQLWPNIRRPEKPGQTWGGAFSKWFTRARRDAGVYDPKVNFHSFRSTVVTALVNADVPEATIKAVVGHSQDSVTMRFYGKRRDVGLLRAAVEKLSYLGIGIAGRPLVSAPGKP